MAKMRALGQGIGEGISTLGEGFSNLGMKRYESDLIQQRQEQLSGLNQKETLLQKALSDPAFARRLKASGLADKLGLQVPDQTPQDLQTVNMDAINKAQKPTDLPTNEQMAANDTMQGGQFTTDGGKDFTGGQIPIGLQEILARTRARNSKAAQFTQEEDSKPVVVPGVNPQGALTESHITQGEAKGQTYQKDRSNIQNSQREGQQAGAVVNAQEGARNSKVNIAGAAERAGAIKAAETANGGGNQGNASATQYYVRALSAANNATKLEQQGVSGAGAKYLPAPMQTQLQKQYNASMDDFVATVVYLQSGKQINENEMATYKKAYFIGPNDDPATILVKQKARARAIAGAKFIAEAGGGRGGLQEYIKSGGKLEDLINPSDPTFDKSDISLPSNKPVYLDENGNPR